MYTRGRFGVIGCTLGGMFGAYWLYTRGQVWGHWLYTRGRFGVTDCTLGGMFGAY